MRNSKTTTKIVTLETYDNDVWAHVTTPDVSYKVRHVSAEYRIGSVINQYRKDGFTVKLK